MTNFSVFETVFNKALKDRILDHQLIYSDEFKEWARKEGFNDLADGDIQTRSYPVEIIRWAKMYLEYLYGDTPRVDASEKIIPEFLRKKT